MPGYKLKPGYIWNPVKKFPRNKSCPCGSLKKFKICCLNKIPHAIDTMEFERMLAKLRTEK